MSTTTFENVLSKEELEYLNNCPEVLLAKSTLDSKTSGMVYFTVPITDSIRDTLQTRLGLSLPVDSKIPMRWIKGDTFPHVDVGASDFENTYLVYLNDSPGELMVDFKSYPIQRNTGFVFNEGLRHETVYTENVPRLMVGPMNEFAEPVGVSPITYFATKADAESNHNYLGYNNNYIVGNTTYIVSNESSLPYTRWKIASYNGEEYLTNEVYNNGDDLNINNNDGYYFFVSRE